MQLQLERLSLEVMIALLHQHFELIDKSNTWKNENVFVSSVASLSKIEEKTSGSPKNFLFVYRFSTLYRNFDI